MTVPDTFSAYYADLLQGTYDCLDRIVLNAFYPLGQTAGGVRTWWRHLHGDDSKLNDDRLRDMAGTFSRRLHAFCAKQGIPIIGAQAGDRKHELAEPYLPKDQNFLRSLSRDQGHCPSPGMGGQAQREWPDHRNTPSKEMALRQAFLLSSDRSGMGPCIDQNVQLSAIWSAGDLERPRVGGTSGLAKEGRDRQGRQLLRRRQRLPRNRPSRGGIKSSRSRRTFA